MDASNDVDSNGCSSGKLEAIEQVVTEEIPRALNIDHTRKPYGGCRVRFGTKFSIDD